MMIINENQKEDLVSRITESVMKQIKKHYGSNKPKYEVVNEAKCWSQGCKLNAFPKIERIFQKVLIYEGIDFETEPNERGGIISFSTDVNAVELSPNRVANWIKQKLKTIEPRLFATKKVDKIAAKHELVGWTIGHYLDGRYTGKNDQQFGENSLCLEVVGITFDNLISLAEDICREFHQESVLVKDYSTHKVLFVNPN